MRTVSVLKKFLLEEGFLGRPLPRHAIHQRLFIFQLVSVQDAVEARYINGLLKIG